jgi:hypothetical protein
MIAQLLQREFVLGRMRRARTLEGDLANRAASDPSLAALFQGVRVQTDEVRNALNEIEAAAARESAKPSKPIEEEVYIPQDRIVSLFQSALEEYYEKVAREMVQGGTAGRQLVGSRVPITDRELVGVAGPEGQRKLFEQFSVTDAGWSSVLVAEGIRAARGWRDFNPQPADPITISNRARIVLVADWATGIPRAQKVGAAIRQELFGDGGGGREQHVIHLGDVYYAGWEREYRNRFLPYWPVKQGEEGQVSSWCLNGNHDMYSGGFGYFDYLLADPRFARQQGSSFFSMQNDHWSILGLDTAYDDESLRDPQPEWVERTLTSSGRAGLLLSHHQLFSAYDLVKPLIFERVSRVVAAGRVRAWFWGHEHRCALYKGRDGVQYARCVGHGGVPTYAPSAPTPPTVLYEFRDSFGGFFEKWSLFGFAVLDFEDDRIQVRYLNEDGQQHHKETLHAS